MSLDEERQRLLLAADQRRSTIHQLWAEVTGLLVTHNNITPATALPPEILSNIFGYLRGPMGVGADLIRATQVCKRWRAVALQDPFLWTSFPAHNVSCVTACLLRSKDRPISLSLTTMLPHSMELVLARVTRRIRSLYVVLPEAEDIEKLLKRLSRPAPLLEELHIAHPSDRRHLSQRSVGVSTSPLFSAQVPSLRSLTLYRVATPFTLPRTLLHLDYTLYEQEITLQEFLTTLAGLPLLESLRFDGVVDDLATANHATVGHATVDLPNLASLVLGLHIPNPTSMLLSALSLPASVNVDIITDLDYEVLDVDTFGDMILKGITTATRPALRSLTGMRRLLFCWDIDRLMLQAHRDPGDYTASPAWSVSAQGVADRWMGLLDCRTLFDTSLIEVLVVTRKPSMWANESCYEGWPALLRSMPALKTLRVICLGYNDIRLLLLALQDLNTDGELACPGLETLEILDVDVSRWAPSLRMLAPLRGSGQEGGALKRVELFNCKLSASWGWKGFMEGYGVEVSIDEV